MVKTLRRSTNVLPNTNFPHHLLAVPASYVWVRAVASGAGGLLPGAGGLPAGTSAGAACDRDTCRGVCVCVCVGGGGGDERPRTAQGAAGGRPKALYGTATALIEASESTFVHRPAAPGRVRLLLLLPAERRRMTKHRLYVHLLALSPCLSDAHELVVRVGLEGDPAVGVAAEHLHAQELEHLRIAGWG